MFRTILALTVLCLGLQSGMGGQTSGKKPAAQDGRKSQAAEPAEPDAVAEDDELVQEDLAPAAVQLPSEAMPPLIRTLYDATRQVKDKAILERLTAARQLIDQGADLTATDNKGRTALHWTTFVSSYATKPEILVAAEDIADAMITRGVDINRQDAYQDTALDYLLYSPNFEMQTLLLEHGANSGFLLGYVPPLGSTVGSILTKPAGPKVQWTGDLTPGQTIDVRLLTAVYSDRSRTGDPVEGVVTYPLCRNGEFYSCKEGDLLLPPGTRVSGTILFAQKAPNKYARPRLVIDFSSIEHPDGRKTTLYSRVLSVDNARETVRNNEILGIIQPHASSKMALTMMAVQSINPIANYTIRAISTAYGLSLRRETAFPAGTDVQIQVLRESKLGGTFPWKAWPDLAIDDEFKSLAAKFPTRTFAKDGTPSDITNLCFLGSREQLISAFGEAGWFQADELSLKSASKTIQATMRQSGYMSAPVSGLRIDDQLPDLVFQKSLNTFAKRHHLRIWKQKATYQGQEVWVAAATHDIAISKGRGGTKWSHRIDPHIDRERDWASTDLMFIGTGQSYGEVERPSVPQKASNATGDLLLTDGRLGVVRLSPAGTKALVLRTER